MYGNVMEKLGGALWWLGTILRIYAGTGFAKAKWSSVL